MIERLSSSGVVMTSRVGFTQFMAPILLTILAPHMAAAQSNLNVVLGYEGMAEYAHDALSSGDTNRRALYSDLVGSRYFDQCSGPGDRRSMSRQFLNTPPEDVAALSDIIEDVATSDAVNRIREATADSMELLPIDVLTVCVFVVPPDSEMAGFVVGTFRGVYGFSESPGILWMLLIPTEGWLDEIFPGLSHEYFHAAAHPDNPMGTNRITLLDLLLNEGGADSFTALLYPDFIPAWTSAITLEQEIQLWPKVQAELDTNNWETIQNILYGDGDTIPDQSGYTIGYQIMQGYLSAHPDDPPVVWSRVNPKVVLQESGYIERVTGGRQVER